MVIWYNIYVLFAVNIVSKILKSEDKHIGIAITQIFRISYFMYIVYQALSSIQSICEQLQKYLLLFFGV